MLGFGHLQGLYRDDQDFGELFEACLKHPKETITFKMNIFQRWPIMRPQVRD